MKLMIVILIGLVVSTNSWSIPVKLIEDKIVDEDLQRFEHSFTQLKVKQTPLNCNYHQIDCVKINLHQMVERDQFARKFWSKPSNKQYNQQQIEYFTEKFTPVLQNIDKANTETLKKILTIHGWLNISKFGAVTDHDAWLIVQHADADPGFQNNVLNKLEKLYKQNETNAQSYAFLYDRLKVNAKQLQRYGTQISCHRDTNGKLVIAPYPVEDLKGIDQRRQQVGMKNITFQDYVDSIKEICLKQFA